MPGQDIVTQAIYAAFEADTTVETELYAEYTGLSQTYDAATDFLLRHGEDIFPGAPIVFISEVGQSHL